MPRKRVFDGQPAFTGLNDAADESQLRDTELRRADNARLTEYRGVTKRLGTKRLHASAIQASTNVLGGFSWASGANVTQLVVCNGLLHTATYAIPLTWTSQAGALTSTLYPSFAPFFDGSAEVCYIADGGPLNKWSGSALTVNIASTPSCTQVAQHNLRLFGAGDSSQPQRLYWSALGNGDTLGITGSAGGYADVRTFGQQDITALQPVGDSLLIFHKRGISVFTGYSQDDIDIDSGTRGLSSDVGTTAPRSVVAVENTVFFLSDRGVYTASLAEGVKPISGPIEGVIKGLDRSRFNRALAAHNPTYREVLFYFPDVGIYAYNYRVGGWTGPWTGVFTTQVPHSLWTAQDGNAVPIVLTGMNDGFVRRLDTGYLDDVVSAGTGGSAFTMTARCHRMYFGDAVGEKALRFLYAVANPRGSATAGISWTMGTGAGSALLPQAGSSTLYDSGAVYDGGLLYDADASSSGRVQAHGRGTHLDVSITDDGQAESVYSKVEAEAFYMGRRG